MMLILRTSCVFQTAIVFDVDPAMDLDEFQAEVTKEMIDVDRS